MILHSRTSSDITQNDYCTRHHGNECVTVEVDEHAKLEVSESTTIVVSSFDRTEVDGLTPDDSERTPDDSERTPHNSEFIHNKPH